jgi:hypothetical protein
MNEYKDDNNERAGAIEAYMIKEGEKIGVVKL